MLQVQREMENVANLWLSRLFSLVFQSFSEDSLLYLGRTVDVIVCGVHSHWCVWCALALVWCALALVCVVCTRTGVCGAMSIAIHTDFIYFLTPYNFYTLLLDIVCTGGGGGEG